FFSSRRRHTRFSRDWSSDVCSSDLLTKPVDPDELRGLIALALEERSRCSPRSGEDPPGQLEFGGMISRCPSMHAVFEKIELAARSEERRVGKEGRSRWWPYA